MLLPVPRPDPEATIAAYAPIGNMILRFSGRREFVAIPNAEAINFRRDQSYTVECWVRPEKVQPFTAAPDNGVVEKWSGGPAGYPYAIRYINQTGGGDAGRVVVARWDGSYSTSVLSEWAIDDGEFHHVAMVFAAGDPGQLSLFVDARPSGGPVDDMTTGPTENDSPLFLGRRGDAPHPNFFAGDLGRVRVWKGALTRKDIEATMYATYFGRYQLRGPDGQVRAELVGNWRCDEGYGDLAYDYSGRDSGRFGGGQEDQAPVWVVSTILPRYGVWVPAAGPRGEVGGGAALEPASYVYAVGQVHTRFPSQSVEKEFYQAVAPDEAHLPPEKLYLKVLGRGENLYIAREMCWTFSISNTDSFVLVPRAERQLVQLIAALQPRLSTSFDVIVGRKGPRAEEDRCPDLRLPTLLCDEVSIFTLAEAVELITQALVEQGFRPEAGQVETVVNLMIPLLANTGDRDEQRGLDFALLRYREVYVRTWRLMFTTDGVSGARIRQEYAFESAATRPADVQGNSRIVDVVFTYRGVETRERVRYFVGVDVGGEFPFVVNGLTRYFPGA
jgi:hypothetical protein